ncbi:M20/M25/M40 family metallo-hydrolase [Ectobacillus ponti]|uniref:M20/M25/M40 family metallo-hydrolase n=1 Tax=Ectobacillus ponti TaxID=2961894 RepID=A0AA42BPA2_9BACI|nr:M20/M25/M40 family metallo-hydrolase [Ectobacillus ponti]MCP8968547.1 M20/M25/M40 family metallo-hydrolase [Ectobacillus ponti]
MQILEMKWQTKEGFLKLLCDLVGFGSITGTPAEVGVAHFIVEQLQTLSYFQEHPEQVRTHLTKDGRLIVTALVKNAAEKQETAVLLSHFDVVAIEDYGRWRHLAFQPEELTKAFQAQKHLLPQDVQRDMETGEWLFGRGTMDMKCGLAAQMAMLERAAAGVFEGNVLLLAVCDEEVNSAGMLAAAPVLLELAEEHQLKYQVCLDSEPHFPRYPGDETNYIYSGSIGKVLPGFFCYGKEAHVGEPLAGLNANLMASYVTCELELNTAYCETVRGEVMQPPTSLQQYDLKKGYSVQTPHKAAVLFNLFVMEKPMEEIVRQLKGSAEAAARSIEETYRRQAQRFAKLQHSDPKELQVKVWTLQELLDYAVQTYGAEAVARLQDIRPEKGEDERDVAVRFVDELASLCNEQAPMIVLFFAPPYYPSVSSEELPHIRRTADHIMQYAWERHGVALQRMLYMPGLSDMSYTSLQQPLSSLEQLTGNMPLWGSVYSLPLEELAKLNVPVINVGPIGRDAHKWTERLDVAYATGPLLSLLEETIRTVLQP